MRHRGRVTGLCVAVLGVMSFVPEASARSLGVGSFVETLFRGTEFAGNPQFLSSPQNGPFFAFDQFNQRLEFNRAGGGFTYESFKFFGPDSFNNPNTLDLGPLKIQLGPDIALGQTQLTGLHQRIGFTTALMPELFIQSETGQRGFNQFTGLTTFSKEPVQYRVTFNGGVQNFEWSGNMGIDADARINVLGFYDVKFQVTNVGSFTADGLAVQDEQVTDFDIGPIDVSGQIGLDLLASLLQGVGGTPVDVPPRILSGASQRGKTVDELLAELQAGQEITSEEAQFLIQQMFIQAIASDPLGTLMNGLPSEVPGFEGLTLDASAGDNREGAGEIAAVPEPGTLLLLLLAAGFSVVFRPMVHRLGAGGASKG
ncbi:MAG: PEP-CTERM sorting domain-containing protein [Phycisphaerae bacterium]